MPQSIFYFNEEIIEQNSSEKSFVNSKPSGLLRRFAPRNDEITHFVDVMHPIKENKQITGKLQHQNETLHFNFELQKAAGEGDCAVIASPFSGRNEICDLLWRAVEQPQNCEKPQAEIREAIINEKFLLEEDQKTWENFEIQQLPYHEAHGIYQMTVKEIQQMLSEELIKVEDNDLLNFLEKNTEYAKEFKELSQLKMILEEQQQIFDKIDIERQQFLSSPSVCQSYIKIIVANEKQWIGKGSLFLAAKEKNVNLCIWQEQENSDELILDENYSYLGNPLPRFHHVVYRQGAIHYDLLIEKPLELINSEIKNLESNNVILFNPN